MNSTQKAGQLITDYGIHDALAIAQDNLNRIGNGYACGYLRHYWNNVIRIIESGIKLQMRYE